jgi:hypothetical protein
VSFIHAKWQCDQNRYLVCNRDRAERRFSTLAGRITDWPACGFSPFWIESASAAPESIKIPPKASPVLWGSGTSAPLFAISNSPLVNDRHRDLNRLFGSESPIADGTESPKMNPECPISTSIVGTILSWPSHPYEPVWCSRVQAPDAQNHRSVRGLTASIMCLE